MVKSYLKSLVLTKRDITLFGASLALVLLLFYNANVSDVISILSRANMLFVLAATGFSFTVVGLRLIRWQVFLDAYKLKMGKFDGVSSYLASLFLANLTPGRFGDVSRSYFIKKRSRAPFFYVLPAVIVERFIDAAVLLFIAVLFSLAFSLYVPTLLRAMLILTGLILSFVLVVLSKKEFAVKSSTHLLRMFSFIRTVKELRPKVNKLITNFYMGMAKLKSMKSFQIVFLTFLCFAFEGGILYFSVLALSSSGLSYIFAIGIVSLAILGGILSTLPGGIGSMEAIIFALLVVAGFESSIALSIALLYRFASYAVIVPFCSIFFFRETRH